MFLTADLIFINDDNIQKILLNWSKTKHKSFNFGYCIFQIWSLCSLKEYQNTFQDGKMKPRGYFYEKVYGPNGKIIKWSWLSFNSLQFYFLEQIDMWVIILNKQNLFLELTNIHFVITRIIFEITNYSGSFVVPACTTRTMKACYEYDRVDFSRAFDLLNDNIYLQWEYIQI